jgi:hypothetical protein
MYNSLCKKNIITSVLQEKAEFRKLAKNAHNHNIDPMNHRHDAIETPLLSESISKHGIGILLHTYIFIIIKSYHPIPWRDSISRHIVPVSSAAGGDDTSRPRRHPGHSIHTYIHISYFFPLANSYVNEHRYVNLDTGAAYPEFAMNLGCVQHWLQMKNYILHMYICM